MHVSRPWKLVLEISPERVYGADVASRSSARPSAAGSRWAAWGRSCSALPRCSRRCTRRRRSSPARAGVRGQRRGERPLDLGADRVAGVRCLAVGPASDRIGRRRSLVLASALLIVPTALLALAPTFEALLVVRAAQGLCMPGDGRRAVHRRGVRPAAGHARHGPVPRRARRRRAGRAARCRARDRGARLARRCRRADADAAGRNDRDAPVAAARRRGTVEAPDRPGDPRGPAAQPDAGGRDAGRIGAVLRLRGGVLVRRLPAPGAALLALADGGQPDLRALAGGRHRAIGGPHRRTRRAGAGWPRPRSACQPSGSA